MGTLQSVGDKGMNSRRGGQKAAGREHLCPLTQGPLSSYLLSEGYPDICTGYGEGSGGMRFTDHPISPPHFSEAG